MDFKGLKPLLKKSSEKLLEFENWRNKLIDEETTRRCSW